TIIFGLTSVWAIAQPISADSLKFLESQLVLSQPDTNRVLLLLRIGSKYSLSDPEFATKYFQEGLALSRKLNYRKGEGNSLRWSGTLLLRQGQYPEALDTYLKALKISEEIHDYKAISAGLGHIGDVYLEQGDYVKARTYFRRAKKIDETTNNPFELTLMLTNLGTSYQEQNNLDSALIFYNQASEAMTNDNKFFLGRLFTKLGEVQTIKGNGVEAMTYFRKSIPFAIANSAPAHLSENYQGIANLFKKRGELDSSIFYAQKALASAHEVNYTKGILAASKLLSEAYEGFDKDRAFQYYKIAMSLKDSLFNTEKVKQVQNLGFVEQQRLQSIEDAKHEYQNRMRLYILLFLLGVFLLLAVMLFRNSRNKQKANTILEQQKEEIQKALNDLKTTQALLIQSEKMASLGQLTAGIAHEIQNPLNFVNNFSEVNKELLLEMNEEIEKGNYAGVQAISKDVISNHEKIDYHGKRADAIVKGMLQHSRNSNGQKEPTDINALADEYLRLAYHGLLAKEKGFNATMNTDYDNSIGSINVIPQDIGRVILNLITNAFYAVNEKSKQSPNGYQPTVSVSTKKANGKIEVTIGDNGNGIPQKVLDKIFLPFFTTKPTGQGTGLGLSLSYDIVKAHGGELKVQTEEYQYTKFTVTLPFDKPSLLR
ncbi:MAG TPA: tetratricopeptide repeat protein, partial [Chryseolinea sp.]|nr:tetratricopeptide repeat protein [Chryseolinea sp.]